MIYWPKHVGDWRRKTSALTILEKGVYGELLDYCYSTEGPLPLQLERIYNIAGARTNAEKYAVDNVLKLFFYKTDLGYMNSRVADELAKWQRKSTNKKKGAFRKWEIEREKRAKAADE